MYGVRNMKREELNDLLVISRIAGLLEGLSSMQGAQLSKAACMRMEEASERLEIFLGDQFAKTVGGDYKAEEAKESAWME